MEISYFIFSHHLDIVIKAALIQASSFSYKEVLCYVYFNPETAKVKR